MTEPSSSAPAMPSSAPRPRALTLVTGGLVLLAALGALVFAVRRRHAETGERAARVAVLARGPRVQVATVELNPAERKLSLPGEVRAWAQATLYAKVAGYVREIRVDKGARVKKGEVLARLESPDSDQAVVAARADLAVKAQQLKRVQGLIESGVVSRQELESADGATRVARAAFDRALANQAYEMLRAPFEGVITARYVDVGALVAAGTGSTQSAQPVVELADLDRLRVQVYLGQDDAARLEVGAPVSLVQADDPGHPIRATVSRMSQGLDPRTRTMLCEIDVDNRPVRLVPGGFVDVTVPLRGARTPSVPGEARVWRGEELFVAVVGDGDRIHLAPVNAGEDTGRRVQILSGLKGGERIVLNASAELSEGDRVEVAPPVAPAR